VLEIKVTVGANVINNGSWKGEQLKELVTGAIKYEVYGDLIPLVHEAMLSVCENDVEEVQKILNKIMIEIR